jgi:hypothetical protein
MLRRTLWQLLACPGQPKLGTLGRGKRHGTRSPGRPGSSCKWEIPDSDSPSRCNLIAAATSQKRSAFFFRSRPPMRVEVSETPLLRSCLVVRSRPRFIVESLCTHVPPSSRSCRTLQQLASHRPHPHSRGYCQYPGHRGAFPSANLRGR